MRTADAAVIETLLGDMLTPDRLADVAKRAVKRASAHDSADTMLAPLTQQLADTEAALARPTAAIAAGGNVPAIVAAIKTAEDTRQSARPTSDRQADAVRRAIPLRA